MNAINSDILILQLLIFIITMVPGVSLPWYLRSLIGRSSRGPVALSVVSGGPHGVPNREKGSPASGTASRTARAVALGASFAVSAVLVLHVQVAPTRTLFCGNTVKYENTCSWNSLILSYSLLISCILWNFLALCGRKLACHLYFQILLIHQIQMRGSLLPGSLLCCPLSPSDAVGFVYAPYSRLVLRLFIYSSYPLNIFYSPSTLEIPRYKRCVTKIYWFLATQCLTRLLLCIFLNGIFWYPLK